MFFSLAHAFRRAGHEVQIYTSEFDPKQFSHLHTGLSVKVVPPQKPFDSVRGATGGRTNRQAKLELLECAREPHFLSGRIFVMNIYVGNLSFKTTEDELRQAFEAFGAVSAVNIISDKETGRPRGFGFVEMTNADEGGKAIEGLHETNLGGRTITVNEARPREPRAGGGGGGGGGMGGGGHRDRGPRR